MKKVMQNLYLWLKYFVAKFLYPMSLRGLSQHYNTVLDALVAGFKKQVTTLENSVKREANKVVYHVLGYTFYVIGYVKNGKLTFTTYEVVSDGYPSTKEKESEGLSFTYYKHDGNDVLSFLDEDERYDISMFFKTYFDCVEAYVMAEEE